MKTIHEISANVLKDMSQQQTAQNELQRVYNGLVELGYNPTTGQTIEAATGNFSGLVYNLIKDEKARHKRFYDEYGIDLPGAAEKIKSISTAAQSKLKQSVRPVSPVSELYLSQFTINDGTVEILPEFNEAYFKEKHSITAEPGMLKNHQQAVDLLNSLFGDSFENEFEMFLRFFRYNPDTKQLGMNIEAYDPGFKKSDWNIHFNQKVEAIIKQRSLEARIK